MRSQDVLHSAYMPHFRAQMNCVPGMVTEFAFTPTYTTSEYRELPYMVDKVANINAIRAKKSIELAALGQTALDPYTFDYLLLCNKICGTSHYNMQMKVVVDSPEEYKTWLSEASQMTIVKQVKGAEVQAQDSIETQSPIDSTGVVDTVAVSKIAMK